MKKTKQALLCLAVFLAVMTVLYLLLVLCAAIPNKAIRVGGLIGYSPYTRGDLTLKDCDVSGSTITGYHNVGAMVGTTMFYGPEQGSITIENCTAKNNTLKYGSAQVGAFAFGASTSGYTEYAPAGFTAENNTVMPISVVTP